MWESPRVLRPIRTPFSSWPPQKKAARRASTLLDDEQAPFLDKLLAREPDGPGRGDSQLLAARGHWGEDIRQARTPAADGEQAQRVGRLWGEGPCQLPGLLPAWFLPPSSGAAAEGKAGLRNRKLLSLFGGAAEIARAFARKGGSSAVVDIATSSINDLSRIAHWNMLCSKVYLFDMVGIDIPCNTWSRARRAPPRSKMPQPLRGDTADTIMGLPNLRPADHEKVLRANRMLYGARKLIKKCFKFGVLGYLENPLTSRIWKSPVVQRLLQDKRVHFIKVHMCMYGTQWRKATGLMVWNVEPFVMRTCHGHKVCERTGRKHLQLTGISGAKFVTEQAQVYPRQFAEALLKGFFELV